MKKTKPFIFIIVFAVAVLLIAPFIGSIKIPFSALTDFNTIAARIFYHIRLPRILTAFIAGTALACCGVALQACSETRWQHRLRWVSPAEQPSGRLYMLSSPL
jgi:ABC-type Fe3+-siderophore transport system permease subunit